jgi:hypothetical protein
MRALGIREVYATNASSGVVFERAGPILDPMYHNSGEFIRVAVFIRFSHYLLNPGDVSERVGYDLQQVRSIAKATVRHLLSNLSSLEPAYQLIQTVCDCFSCCWL